MSNIIIGDVLLTTGMTVRANMYAEESEIAPEGLKPVIYRIAKEGHTAVIGLYHPHGKVRDYSWGDLDGEVEAHCGYWITLEGFLECFELPDCRAEVVADVIFKGRNLKGMKGKVVASGELMFVELEEDIGGCSADGLGKSGHCVALNPKEIKLGSNYRSLRSLDFEKFKFI